MKGQRNEHIISKSSNGYELIRSIKHGTEVIIKIEKKRKKETEQNVFRCKLSKRNKKTQTQTPKTKTSGNRKEIANEIGFLLNFKIQTQRKKK